MDLTSEQIRKKRKRIIFFVKTSVYILVALMYYAFFQIFLSFLNLYVEKYKQDVDVVYSQLEDSKKDLLNLKNKIEKKKDGYLKLILEINKKNSEFKKKQKEILEKMKKILDNNIIAYGYYCHYINKKIINKKDKFLVNLNDIKLNYPVLTKVKLKNKLKQVDKEQKELVNNIVNFYYDNCNQDSWFKTLVKKYFDGEEN